MSKSNRLILYAVLLLATLLVGTDDNKSTQKTLLMIMIVCVWAQILLQIIINRIKKQ